ncbi:hypothetical protein C6B37_02590 [Candidatus Phytoplasma phoenicium]|uniref:Uncharacterized protein n=1 Tax=Candidatus Phytoplasma phoenicium TaxID=198422 RepID=A0A2S8NT36_9MOLU|nr:hypothetical protein C6B37_02590 [Candidatus Phytoplasma phoenicium]
MKTPLTQALTNTNLGWLDDNKENTVKKEIIKQNVSLHNKVISITAITDTQASVTVPTEHLGTSIVTYRLKTPSTQALTNTNLGWLDDNKENTVKKEIIKQNVSLRNKVISITAITDTQASVTVPTEHLGTSIVTYRLKTPLTQALTNTNLGWLDDNKENTIKKEIIKQNVSLHNKVISITAITDTQAQVTSLQHLGTSIVTYRLKTPLTQALTNTNLGWLNYKIIISFIIFLLCVIYLYFKIKKNK